MATIILIAVSITTVSFIPVFTMQAANGKLLGPLAFTKTFALVAALIVSLLILPTLAYWFFGARIRTEKVRQLVNVGLILIGTIALIFGQVWVGIMLILFGLVVLFKTWFNRKDHPNALYHFLINKAELILAVIGVVWLLCKYWLPLGASHSLVANVLFVAVLIGFLYFQFKSTTTSLMVFSGIAMAFSGGFIMIWLYGQGWFMDFSVFDTNIRDLFQMKTINLSVAVWVGFIALVWHCN